jgi:N-hydroxyarylamine O-acetyltransferase
MPLSLAAYLQRIGCAGPIEPSFAVLRDVHRAHLLTIPYENLDIHLGRPLSLNIETIYDKIVNRRRGGWCYEMNGLLAWALREIGFEVHLVSGAVNRARAGDLAEGNHLVLLVQLDQPYVADAGFGNAFLEPLPLFDGEHEQHGFRFRLERSPTPNLPQGRSASPSEQGGEGWIFHNHAFGGAGYDFTTTPRRIEDFAERSQWLQTSPESGFVRVSVCHRFTEHGYITLRGLMLETVSPNEVHTRTINDIVDYRDVLCDQFGLVLDSDIDQLWQKARQSHLEWLESQQTRLSG